MGPCSMVEDNQVKDFFYKIDEMPDIINLGVKGGNNQWTFSTLKSPMSYIYKLANVDEGKYSLYFKDATMVLREPLGKEIYYTSRSGKWYIVGEATLKKNSILPEVKVYDIPLPACTPRINARPRVVSAKYTIDTTISKIDIRDTKDASGVLYLPDGIYDVDRTERTMTIKGDGPTEIHTSYVFTEQLTGTFIMEVEVSPSDELTKVIYKTKDINSTAVSRNLTNDFLLYPNRGFGQIRLDFKNFNSGQYTLMVKDFFGKKIWSNSYSINGDAIIKEDLSFLPRGLYIYALLDGAQNIIITRRLGIIKS